MIRACVLALLWPSAARAVYASSLRPWTLSEEIGLASFFPYHGTPAITESPNGRYVAVESERGLLRVDRVEDELRVYDRVILRRYAEDSKLPGLPLPILDIRESTYKQGPVIAHITWLRNSTGVVFLLRNSEGKNGLALLSLTNARPKILSLKGQNVTAFDVRDSAHYVYTVLDLADSSPLWTKGRVVRDVTGHPLWETLLPSEWREEVSAFEGPPATSPLRSVIWAAVDGEPREVREGGHPIVVYPGPGSLALSPNDSTLATEMPVVSVPSTWIDQFRPAPGDSFIRMRPGVQDLNSTFGGPLLVSEYVLINIKTGAVRRVNGTPTGEAAGWFTEGNLAWSSDGRALLLPDAFLKPLRADQRLSAPCIAAVDVTSGDVQCVEPLHSIFSEVTSSTGKVVFIKSERFAKSGTNKVIVRYTQYLNNNAKEGVEVLVNTRPGVWRASVDGAVSKRGRAEPDVYIKQGLNEPPEVVEKGGASNTSRVIWDPNPQLKHVALGDVSVYRWKDATGHEWTGGLYKPANYASGRRYPLVIQTHGFLRDRFSSSGMFPTGMAARALAQDGIAVLQVSMCPYQVDLKSGPCEVALYDGAIEQLVSDGMIDPHRIGIVGFSYTVYTVMDALVTSAFRFAAASVTDGDSYGYWEYITNVDTGYESQADPTIGAKPFGSGLRVWLTRAPDFNMEKVRTPLLVNSLGRISLLTEMWEPYATLRALGKPADLRILDSGEHVLTDPAVRMASQGGAVDWFRFWLQGYEDPDPRKASQYRRWEGLCTMQRTQSHDDPVFCKPSGDESPYGSLSAR